MFQSPFRGIGYTTIAQAIAMVSQFGVSILLTRALGPEQFGLYSVFLNFTTAVGTLSNFGVNSAVTKYIADYKAKDDDVSAKNILLGAISLHLLLFGLLCFVAYLFADTIIHIWFNDKQTIYILSLCSIPLFVLIGDLTGALYGYRQLISAGNRIILQAFLLLSMNLFAVFVFSIDVQIASVNYTLSLLLLFILLIWYSRNHIDLRQLRSVRPDIYKIIKFSWPIGLIFPIQSSISYAPVLIAKAVGSSNTDSHVGNLALAILFGNIVHNLLMSVIRSMYGYAATWYAQNHIHKLKRYLQQMHVAIAIVYAILFAFCIWLLPAFITFVYGTAYIQAARYTFFVLVANFTRTLTVLNNSFLHTFEQTFGTLAAHGIEFILYITIITYLMMTLQSDNDWPIVLLTVSIITGLTKVIILSSMSWRTLRVFQQNVTATTR